MAHGRSSTATPGTDSTATPGGATGLLTDPRFELLPFASFDEQLAALPDGAKVAITSSPKKGIETTVEMSVKAAERGYEVSPHIAARGVRDEAQLRDIVARLDDAGITDVFVPGGDNEEAGEFESSYELLTTLDTFDHPFEEIGITGYPEGHHFLDDETLWEALRKKEPYGTYIVTQLCFDSEAIVSWIEDVRGRGIDLPVHAGIPGVMKYQRLLKISNKVGVGDSINFLRKTTGIFDFVRQLIGSRGQYTPDRLIDGLAPYYGDPEYGVDGVHLYTFNEVPDTESWRQKRL